MIDLDYLHKMVLNPKKFSSRRSGKTTKMLVEVLNETDFVEDTTLYVMVSKGQEKDIFNRLVGIGRELKFPLKLNVDRPYTIELQSNVRIVVEAYNGRQQIAQLPRENVFYDTSVKSGKQFYNQEYRVEFI